MSHKSHLTKSFLRYFEVRNSCLHAPQTWYNQSRFIIIIISTSCLTVSDQRGSNHIPVAALTQQSMETHHKKEEDDDDKSLHFEDVDFPPTRSSKELDKQVPGAIECSFGSSSQRSSGYLFVNDDGEEDDDSDRSSSISSGSACEDGDRIYLTPIGNGHCSWADESSTSPLIAHIEESSVPYGNKHNKKTKIRKCVRFATYPDGSVQSSTRLQSLNSQDCWWRRKDAMRIHAECQAVAAHFKAHYPKYKEAIAGLSFSTHEDMTKEEIAKYQEELSKSEHEAARGLEGFISELKDILGKTHEGLVLLAQDEQREQGTHFDTDGLEAIREVSRKTSRPARQLALKLAEYDTVEAFVAMLLPWKLDDEEGNKNEEKDNATSTVGWLRSAVLNDL